MNKFFHFGALAGALGLAFVAFAANAAEPAPFAVAQAPDQAPDAGEPDVVNPEEDGKDRPRRREGAAGEKQKGGELTDEERARRKEERAKRDPAGGDRAKGGEVSEEEKARRKEERAKREADRQKQEDDRARAEAEKQKQDADRAKADAAKQDQDEDRARAEAEKQKQEQDRAKADAAKQKQDAERARAEADKQKQDAERAKADAAKQKQDAAQARAAADRQKQDAERAKADAAKQKLEQERAKAATERSKREGDRAQALPPGFGNVPGNIKEKLERRRDERRDGRDDDDDDDDDDDAKERRDGDNRRNARDNDDEDEDERQERRQREEDAREERDNRRGDRDEAREERRDEDREKTRQRAEELKEKAEQDYEKARDERRKQRERASRFRTDRRDVARERRIEDFEKRFDQLRGQRRERVDAGGRIVIEEPGNRRIIRDGGRVIINRDEGERFRRNARSVRTERRRDGTTANIAVRPGGIEIITITDNDGRLVRRLRRGRDGRETVILDNSRVFDPRPRPWRRPGDRRSGFDVIVDLPPPVIRIPRDKYVVDYDEADPEDIFEALNAPPVERLDRGYSLEEVRRSRSLRERMRRVDLDAINFEFGSWEVENDQYPKLEIVARALKRVLRRNPDEVFMIEGHTDAVGSDVDNLSLSDRRAESVAVILTDVFEVPPENLVTQGYGEEFLKIDTPYPERENRRVAVRRITPLLSSYDSRYRNEDASRWEGGGRGDDYDDGQPYRR